MAAIYTTLFWCAVQVTLFLLLAAPAYLVVRRRSSRAATIAAANCLAAVILLSALATSPWPRWSLAVNRDRLAAPASPVSMGPSFGGGQASIHVTGKQVAANAAPSASSTTGLADSETEAKSSAPPTPPINDVETIAGRRFSQWPHAIAFLFLAGLTISGLRLAVGLVAVRRLVAGSQAVKNAALLAEVTRLSGRLDLRRPVTLHESAEIATPATIGWRRPAILLPPEWRTWRPEDLRAVLAHELAHIAHHDFAAWLVARTALTLHFYHPLVRWFTSRLQLDQELAADATAVRVLGNRESYLQSLARVVLGASPRRLAWPAKAFIPHRSMLAARVTAIHADAAALRWSRSAQGAWLALLVACAVGAAGFRAEARANDPPATSSKAVDDRTAVLVRGVVVDAASNPVPQALVICHREEICGGDIETVSDEQGKFEFSVKKPIKRLEMLHTWAYAEGHAFRTVMLRTIGQESAIVEAPIIQLPPAERFSIAVNAPKVEPAVGAMVAPRIVQVPNGVYAADESTGLGGWVPDRLAEVLARPVEKDGKVSFDSIPLKLLDSLRVESAKFGVQDFEDFEDELRLSSAGSVAGVIDAADLTALAGIDVYLLTEARDFNVPKMRRSGFAKTKVDANGRFVVPALAEGELKVQFDWPEQSETRPILDDKEPVVASELTSELLVKEVPAVTVRGRLVAGEERQPVCGAFVCAGNSALGFGHSAPVETDADGKFAVKTIAGVVRVQVISQGQAAAKGRRYDFPRIRAIVVPEGVGDFEVGEILMKPMQLVSGTLLMSDGEPSVQTDIALKAPELRHFFGRTTTDHEGNFNMAVEDYEAGLRDEQLYRSQGRWPTQWVKLAPVASPMETPERIELKIVSEAPLVLQEP